MHLRPSAARGGPCHHHKACIGAAAVPLARPLLAPPRLGLLGVSGGGGSSATSGIGGGGIGGGDRRRWGPGGGGASAPLLLLPAPPPRALSPQAYYADKPLPRVARNADGSTSVEIAAEIASGGGGGRHASAVAAAAVAAAAAAAASAAAAAVAAARAEEAIELARPPKRVPVQFLLGQYVTRVGQALRVVGAADELGAWDPGKVPPPNAANQPCVYAANTIVRCFGSRTQPQSPHSSLILISLPLLHATRAQAPVMTWHEGHAWSLDVELGVGPHEFKLVMTSDDGAPPRWEDGANRAVVLPATVGVADLRRGSTGDGATVGSGSSSDADSGDSGGGGGGFALAPTNVLAAGTLPVGAAGVAMAWDDQDGTRLALLPRKRLVRHRFKWLEARLEALARRRLRAAARAAAQALLERSSGSGDGDAEGSSSGAVVIDAEAAAAEGGLALAAVAGDSNGNGNGNGAPQLVMAADSSLPASFAAETAAQRALSDTARRLLADATQALERGDAGPGAVAMLGGGDDAGAHSGTLAAAALLEELTVRGLAWTCLVCHPLVCVRRLCAMRGCMRAVALVSSYSASATLTTHNTPLETNNNDIHTHSLRQPSTRSSARTTPTRRSCARCVRRRRRARPDCCAPAATAMPPGSCCRRR